MKGRIPEIDIYAPDGTVRLTAHIGKGSTRKYQLMQHDEVELKFTLGKAVLLHVGDYIELENIGRFELAKQYKPEQSRTSRGYDYTLTFQAQYYKFRNKIVKFLPGIGMAETSWSYTDTLDKHLAHILANMNYLAYGQVVQSQVTTPSGTVGLQTSQLPEAANPSYLHNGVSQWLGAIDETVENKAVSISYDKKNFIDAISDLAAAYEVEWWFVDNILYFGKRQFDNEPINLKYGENVIDISRSSTKESEATRLYIYGSDRNVASTYRKRLVFYADYLKDNGEDGVLIRDKNRDLKPKWFPKHMLSANTANDKTVFFLTGFTNVQLPYRKKDDSSYTYQLVLFPQESYNMKAGVYKVQASKVRPVVKISPKGKVEVRNISVYIHYNDSYTAKEGKMNGRIDASLDPDKHGSYDMSQWTKIESTSTADKKEWYFCFEDTELSIGSDTTLDFTIMCQIDIQAATDDLGLSLSLEVGEKYNKWLKLENCTPTFKVNNLTINVLDSEGLIKQILYGCTLNPNFATSDIPILIPKDSVRNSYGGLKIAVGDMFELPDIYSSIVPASYFTNKYTVADQFSDLVTTGIISRRLMLPETNPETGAPQPSYIDIVPPESVEEAIEDVKVFEDIYPSNTSTITEVFTDPKDEEIPEQDGSVTYRPWTSYRFRDDFFTPEHPFNLDIYKIEGKDLEITFQGIKRYETEEEASYHGKHKGDPVYDNTNGGKLSGMTFKVAYLEDDGGTFEIQRDQTTLLPNDIVKPQIGDTFILSGFHISMLSDTNCDYIKNAEHRLYYKAKEYANKLNTDASVYNCTIGCDYALEYLSERENDLCFDVGTSVNLEHSPYFFEQGRISRIIGFEIKLDRPENNPIYIIGEKAKYNKFGEIKDSIDNLQIIAGSLTDGSFGSGGMANIITSTSATDATDSNVYSALRTGKEIESRAISKLSEDTAAGRITFKKGLKSELVSYFSGGAVFGDTSIEGMLMGRGASIDLFGNAEVESLKVRSVLEVYQLIYNRLNAIEGNTSFADSGTIESVFSEGASGGDSSEDGDGESQPEGEPASQSEDNGDGGESPSSSTSSQILVMHKRFEGDFTSFQIGDVVYGFVNELNKSGIYYKSWGRVTSVNREENTLTVNLYSPEMCPAGTNYEFRPNMVITRWGNAIEPDESTCSNPDYASFIKQEGEDKYVNTRRTTFYISTEDGNIVELMGVYQPIIDKTNYATIVGRIPEGLLDEKTSGLINKTQPYIYARGLIVQDLIQIDYQGVPMRTQNYRGEWIEGEIYRSGKTFYDVVTHNGIMWQCLAEETTEEPTVASRHWCQMTDKTINITMDMYSIIPSASQITLRNNEDGTTTVNPSKVTCRVLLTNAYGRQSYVGGYDLALRGVSLYYSLDGVNWRNFVVGEQEPLELEDGTDVLVTEDSTEESIDVLTVGGEDIDSTELSDKIFFRLLDSDNIELAKETIPVVIVGRDGVDGVDGADGADGESPVCVTLTPENLSLVEPGVYYVLLEVWQGSSVRIPYNATEKPYFTFTPPWHRTGKVDGIDNIEWSVSESDGKALIRLDYSGDPVEATVTFNVSVRVEESNSAVKFPKSLHLVTPKNGEEGKAGLMVYPAGEYDPEVLYISEGDTTPVVLFNEHYFVLKRGFSYQGINEPTAYNNPSKDVADNPTPRWELMTQFKSVFADIIMAEFAKLGKAVFYGDWMISQWGNLITNKIEVNAVKQIGVASSYTVTYLLVLAGNEPELPPDTDNTLVGFDYTAYDEAGSVLDTYGYLEFYNGTTKTGEALVNLTPKHQHVQAVDWQFATSTDGVTPGNWYNTPGTTATWPYQHIKAIVTTREINSEGVESNEYQLFKQDRFEPKLKINFVSGKLRAHDAEIRGTVTADKLSLGMATVSTGALLTRAFNIADMTSTMIFGLPALSAGTSRTIDLMLRAKNTSQTAQVTFMKENDTDDVKMIYLGKTYDGSAHKSLTSSGGLYRLTGWCSSEDRITYWNITAPDSPEPSAPDLQILPIRPSGGFLRIEDDYIVL